MAELSRRDMIKGAAGAAVVAASGTLLAPQNAHAADDDPAWKIKNGRITQSVIHWCFKPMPLETLAKAAAELGIKSVELIPPEEWPILKKYGLTCAIAGSHGFVKGFNHVENHEMCIEKIKKSVDASAEFGCPNVITFSGMREKMSDEEGLKNTVDGIKKVIGYCEEKKVNLCIEMLNSKVNVEMKGHPGYQCDNLPFAMEVCKKVGSPRMKILFDIYHVQIMHGDIIARIKECKDYIGHIHTAGNPGRNEIDETQEINYPPVMKALLDVGYKGFVGQEFIPKREDKIASLRQAARICDV
ncbi:MAG TPA: TIM barrel protein [Planctomycetota bacterium]|nr:TIM barrel protein [Planctomycetota bacterium]